MQFSFLAERKIVDLEQEVMHLNELLLEKDNYNKTNINPHFDVQKSQRYNNQKQIKYRLEAFEKIVLKRHSIQFESITITEKKSESDKFNVFYIDPDQKNKKIANTVCVVEHFTRIT